MDTIYRYLPILIVVGFGLLINPFQEADAQTFPNPVPFQYRYQTGNVNDSFTTTTLRSQQINQTQSPFNFNPWWLILALLVPAGYFGWNKLISFIRVQEPIGRGYQISYQDIRRIKKRTFRISRKAKAF